MTTTFFRILKDKYKEPALKEAIYSYNANNPKEESVFAVDPSKFKKVPNSPFAYWVDDSIRNIFQKFPPFESEGRTVKQGLATADDFRFVRTWWEVPAEKRLDAGKGPDWRDDIRGFQEWCKERTKKGKYWVPFAKGGEYSPYYSDIHLVVNWKGDGKEIKNFVNPKTGKLNSRPQNTDYYFMPGLTWSDRTTSIFSARNWPAGGIFSVKGSAGFFNNLNYYSLSLMNSSVFNLLLSLLVGATDAAARSYQVGLISSVPFIKPDSESEKRIKNNISNIFKFITHNKSSEETDLFLFSLFKKYKMELDLKDQSFIRGNVEKIELILKKIYKIENSELLLPFNTKVINNINIPAEIAIHNIFLFVFSIIFGRWDIRMAVDPFLVPELADPFDPLPVCPPATLVGPDGLPAESGNIVSEEWLKARQNAITLPPKGSVSKETIAESEYPIDLPWDGILVDDPGNSRDIIERMRKVMEIIWKDKAYSMEQEVCEEIGVKDVREYFRKPSGFFEDHLNRYSKSRRKAPIYWPLSTKSGNYTIWIYYPKLSEATLYGCVNILDEKIKTTENDLQSVKKKLSEEKSEELKKEYESLSELLSEIIEMKEELLSVAALPYKPDLDDGVVICAAPLKNLFRLSKWKKELEKHWKALEKGEYDWAHLAMAIWPDRVNEKCKKDKSLAIAHGLEELYEN